MVAAYCHGDRIGVQILKQSARLGCLRSAYALGIILRDFNKSLSESYLQFAISCNYLPACQELLTSQQVKDKFGELGPITLKQFFDPIGLYQLLSKCYLQSNGVRGVATSHCWNPCCGRWALKATQSNDGRTQQLRCPSKCLPPLEEEIEKMLLNLVQSNRIRSRSMKKKSNHHHNDSMMNSYKRTIKGKGCSSEGGIDNCTWEFDSSSDFEMSDVEDDDIDHDNDEDNINGEDEQEANRTNTTTNATIQQQQHEANTSNATSTSVAAVATMTKRNNENTHKRKGRSLRVSRMKMCSSCRRAKYCSKLCQVYDWRSGRHKLECQYL